MRRVYFKHPSDPPVRLTGWHFRPEVARIIWICAQEWPEQSPIVITRGSEDVPGGHPRSLHLVGQAFDLRTRHLISSVDRQALLDRILARLGPGYGGYYGQRDGVEWFHLQWEAQ
jgi:sirohydrochlorin ferrochelatase